MSECRCARMYLGGLDCTHLRTEICAGVHACEYMGSHLLTNMCLLTRARRLVK